MLCAETTIPLNENPVLVPANMQYCAVSLAHVNHSVSNLNHVLFPFLMFLLYYKKESFAQIYNYFCSFLVFSGETSFLYKLRNSECRVSNSVICFLSVSNDWIISNSEVLIFSSNRSKRSLSCSLSFLVTYQLSQGSEDDSCRWCHRQTRSWRLSSNHLYTAIPTTTAATSTMKSIIAHSL